MNLNGRIAKLEQAITGTMQQTRVHLGTDGSIGLYQNGRLVQDLGATLGKIYGGVLPIPPESPGPAAPESFEQLLARVWSETE